MMLIDATQLRIEDLYSTDSVVCLEAVRYAVNILSVEITHLVFFHLYQ